MRKTKYVILITLLIVMAALSVYPAEAHTGFNHHLNKRTIKVQTVTLTVVVYKYKPLYFERPEPIAGATVSATSDVHSAAGVTDEKGLCHLQVLPSFFYTLKVHKSGYRSFSMGFSIKCDTIITVILKKTLQNTQESGNHLIPQQTSSLQLNKMFSSFTSRFHPPKRTLAVHLFSKLE